MFERQGQPEGKPRSWQGFWRYSQLPLALVDWVPFVVKPPALGFGFMCDLVFSDRSAFFESLWQFARGVSINKLLALAMQVEPERSCNLLTLIDACCSLLPHLSHLWAAFGSTCHESFWQLCPTKLATPILGFCLKPLAHGLQRCYVRLACGAPICLAFQVANTQTDSPCISSLSNFASHPTSHRQCWR